MALENIVLNVTNKKTNQSLSNFQTGRDVVAIRVCGFDGWLVA